MYSNGVGHEVLLLCSILLPFCGNSFGKRVEVFFLSSNSQFRTNISKIDEFLSSEKFHRKFEISNPDLVFVPVKNENKGDYYLIVVNLRENELEIYDHYDNNHSHSIKAITAAFRKIPKYENVSFKKRIKSVPL